MSLHNERVVVLVDMDCFYCQVEEKLDPNLIGKPIAVVQYNAWRGGGIIAVNYPARDRGVTRHMRGNEAKEKCPEIQLVKVPNIRGKADLTKYREAGKKVAEVLQKFTPLLQRASIDEAYMDITEAVNKKILETSETLTTANLPNTFVVGCDTSDFIHNIYNSDLRNDNNLKLAVGGTIVEEIRATVYEKTGYRCSAGIAHNKILAKLACGLHKPNKQTILPQDSVEQLYQTLPLRKIKNLGGKFGNSLSEDLNITYMGELIKFSERDLLKKYDEKTALWLYNIARGVDKEPVETRLISKSIGCCKKFPGKNCLKNEEQVTHWLSELAIEISERLERDIEENNRRAKQVTVSFAQVSNKKETHSSRCHPLNSYDSKKITNDAFEIIKKYTQKPDGSFSITFLGLNVSKFEDSKHMLDISTFFKKSTQVNDKTKIETIVPEKPETVLQENINKFEKSKNLYDISNFFKKNTHINDNTKIETNVLENTKTIVNNTNDTLNDGKNEEPTVEKKEKVKSVFYIKEDLNLEEIEKDALQSNEINLDETLKSIENRKYENDEFLNATLKLDCTEILKEKQEFPNVLNESENDTKKNKKQSFFIKYVKKLDTKGNDYSEEMTLSEIYEEINNSDIPIIENLSDDNEKCCECDKVVSKNELVLHMDQHLAQKLMIEERQQFHQQLEAKKQNIKSTVKSNKTKGHKRKLFTNDNNRSITSYLAQQNNVPDDTESKQCPECYKKILINEFACHLDFHAAKKLHLELNPVKMGDSTNNQIKNTNKKKSTTSNIPNYFKIVSN